MANGKIIGIVLLVIGIALLFFGFNATQSLSGELSEAFTGKYSDETMAYLIGGAASAVVGLVLLLRSK